jgi:hypothetical protein
MEKTTLQTMTEYVVNLESGLYYWNGPLTRFMNELPTVQELIDDLLDAAFESTDSAEKAVLRRLQSKAFGCREHILKQIGAKNLPCRNTPAAGTYVGALGD